MGEHGGAFNKCSLCCASRGQGQADALVPVEAPFFQFKPHPGILATDSGNKGHRKMGWHVRYIDNSLKHDMLSREWSTEDEALEEAWTLAQGDNQVTAIEGPDEEIVTLDEILVWFEKRASSKKRSRKAGPAT
jgi:hypothetical protein